jgi:flagellar biosynthetic protein FlhB
VKFVDTKEYFASFSLPGQYIHLQWFAAEDEGRTEDPTEYKIRKAREEGKVAKSAELTSSVILLVGIVIIAIMASTILNTTLEMMQFFFINNTTIDVSTDMRLWPLFFKYFIKMTLPIMITVFIAALLGDLIQVGFLFTAKPLTPDFNKITPKIGRYLQRTLFSAEAVFNLGKAIFKVIIVAVIAYLNITGDFAQLCGLIQKPFLAGLGLISAIAFRIIVEAAIAMLALSIFDYLFQRRQHRESLKMSKQEIKEERKMFEGDPLIKSRLRERMRELLSKNMLKAVPKADVVITNPTHYAIAMEWNRLSMQAPVVTAKGMNEIALKIKEVALAHAIPVMENKPLAQALYKEVEIGEAIPERFYEVVATVLAEVYRLNGKSAFTA